MIEAKNLSFSYGKRRVLNNLSFSIDEGELVCVLGPNGVGKSTLFRCILGLLRSYSGSILLNGSEVKALAPLQLSRLVAYIPQSSTPIYNYTVADTVLMGTTGSLNPLARPSRAQLDTAQRAIEDLGIGELQSRGIAEISGGELQLTLIARALAQNAHILIMDEPTANLDYGNSFRVMDRIAQLGRCGYTVMMSTHNPEQALRYSTAVLAMLPNGTCAYGKTDSLVDEKLIEQLYGLPVMLTRTPCGTGSISSCFPTVR